MNAIQIKNLVKNYGENKVLKNINLTIEQWDFFALLWHNGAWKTTMISILTNLVNKTSGQVKIAEVDIDTDFALARTHIWVVPQEFNFDQFAKVQDIPVIQAWFYGVNKKTAIERTEIYLKKLWLWEKRNNKARELSGGMKRRLMIVRALVHEPKILILDEPTAWVDVELRNGMWKFIRELNQSGTTILLTTHYLEEVEALCKNVAIINKGEIIENTSVKKLLGELDEETIILDTKQHLDSIPQALEQKFQAKALDDNEIEVVLWRGHTLNQLFETLNQSHIEVKSFRNKVNRLEQLFINKTK